MSDVPRANSFIFDDQTRAGIAEYMNRTGFNRTTAVRTLIALGLSTPESRQHEMLRRMKVEALMAASSVLRREVETALAAAFKKMENE